MALYSGRMLADCIWTADGGGVGAINGGGWPAKTQVLLQNKRPRENDFTRPWTCIWAEFY